MADSLPPDHRSAVRNLRLVHELVAVDLAAGPAWVDVLRRIWDDGDAILPIDRRLPPPARAAVLAAAAPTLLIDAAGRHTLDDGRPVEPGDALVMATSGSTGTPKAVVLTHDALAASATATSARVDVAPDDHWLACLPLAHIGGFGVVARALLTGTALTIHDGFDAAAVEGAARDGCTLVSLVATALRRIDPAWFRVVLVGGSRPPAHRPANVLATYGLTETCGGIAYDGVPLGGVELRIADSDDHGVGEVLVRTPTSMRCYRDGSTIVDHDGWTRTDDLGSLDAAGSLHVVGRRGDVIVTGGHKVWPEAVERVLAESPELAGLGEAVVVGVDDDEWGRRVVVVAAPRPGASVPRLATIRSIVKTQLATYAAPKELHLVDQIPRTALGKPQRHLVHLDPSTLRERS